MPAHLIPLDVITLIMLGEEYSHELLGSVEVNGDIPWVRVFIQYPLVDRAVRKFSFFLEPMFICSQDTVAGP